MTDVRILTNATAESAAEPLRHQAYNAMDACLTVGIHDALQAKLADKPEEERIYRFECAMQGPAFTMAVRGIAVNESAAKVELARLIDAEARVILHLRHLAAVWMDVGDIDLEAIRTGLAKQRLKGLNPHSGKQVKELLYEHCGETPYKARPKPDEDEGDATVNEEALTMLQARSPIIGVMAHLILRARGLRKLRSFIAARRSPDGRLRSSFNVGATTSGRWSFGKNCFRDGLNFGNIPKTARTMFVPSTPERVMVNVDLQQAESYIVAIISDDEAYRRAHETGDAHGAVALDVYGHMLPDGADPAAWVREKSSALPRGESPRQACKKLTHGGNYGLGERKASKITGMKIADIAAFRRKFFARYPGVADRIAGMPGRLKASRHFVSVVGRPHWHSGNPNDPETHRAALADEPQGVVADVLCVALWRLWRWHDVGPLLPRIWILAQNYDSILFECLREDVEAAREACAKAFAIPIRHDGNEYVIPHDFASGPNWRACT